MKGVHSMRSMASKTEFRVLGAQRTVVVWYRRLFDTIQVYLSVLLYESKESSIDSSRMISNFPKVLSLNRLLCKSEWTICN